jgi:hypothetical protein
MRHYRNKHGAVGVYLYSYDGKRFRSQFFSRGRKYYCGTYQTVEEAAAARERRKALISRERNLKY